MFSRMVFTNPESDDPDRIFASHCASRENQRTILPRSEFKEVLLR
jgi:hypothetical protein